MAKKRDAGLRRGQRGVVTARYAPTSLGRNKSEWEPCAFILGMVWEGHVINPPGLKR